MRVSSDGKKKWAILTTKPAAASGVPVVAELVAGIDPSCVILESAINWTRTSSDKIPEKVSCVKGKAESFGPDNYDLALTFIREWLEAGGADVTALDQGYQAVRVKDTTVWIYLRDSDKDSTDPWEAGDIIDLGGEVKSDGPLLGQGEGSQKRRVEFAAQNMIVEQPILAA